MGKTAEMEEANIMVGLGGLGNNDIILVIPGIIAIHLSAGKAAELATRLMNGVHAIERRGTSGAHL